MAQIRFADADCELDPGESVLECLTRHGHSLPSSCRTGVCQSCMLRCEHGAIPEAARAGLKAQWVAQGYFLPCVCRPEADLVVDRCDAEGLLYRTQLVGVHRLSSDVVRVRLETPPGFVFEAGQFVQLIRPDLGIGRPYSIASVPDEDLEFHVRVVRAGVVSPWLAEASPGTEVEVQGPTGVCVYLDDIRENPLLLAGTGTGLAPLLGILRQALRAGHRGPIDFYRGALSKDGFYPCDALDELAAGYSQLRVHECVLHGAARPPNRRVINIERAIQEDGTATSDTVAYVCGSPEFVQSLKKKLYLSGIDLSNILADAFVPAAT